MKTKEVIKLLQEEDPSGELECCVGNADIYYIETLPCYYDGCQQVLIRDPNNKYYNVIGAKFIGHGTKINIRTLSISDAIFNDENLPVEYDADYSKRHYEKWVDRQKEQAKEIKEDVEKRTFIEYCKNRFSKEDEMFDFSDIEESAGKFYDEQMSYKDKMPDDIKNLKIKTDYGFCYGSHNDKRFAQWDREITMELIDGKITLKKEKKPEIFKNNLFTNNNKIKKPIDYILYCSIFSSLFLIVTAISGNLYFLSPAILLLLVLLYKVNVNLKNQANSDQSSSNSP